MADTQASLDGFASAIVLSGGGSALQLSAKTYVTGGALVVTTPSEGSAAALSVAGSQAILDVKDVDAFALRNRKYTSDSGVLDQLPLATTRDGRLLVNPPGLLPDDDERVAGSALTVFGGVRAERATLDTLVVREMRSPAFVQQIDAACDGGIVVTRGDGTTSDLPVGWDAIRGKPATFPADSSITTAIPYLTDRVRIAQFNVDFLLAEMERMQSGFDSLRRTSVGGGLCAFGPAPDAAGIRRSLTARLEEGVDAVRR